MFLFFKKAWNLWIRFNITCICMCIPDVRVTVLISGCSCRQFNFWLMGSRHTFEITSCITESISAVIHSVLPQWLTSLPPALCALSWCSRVLGRRSCLQAEGNNQQSCISANVVKFRKPSVRLQASCQAPC